MDTSLLREFIDEILRLEDTLSPQQRADELHSQLSELSNSPQDTKHQSRVSNTFQRLESALREFDTQFSPRDQRRLEEIGGADFFGSSVGSKIRAVILENPLSPVVARDHVRDLVSRRQQYLTTLRGLRDNLTAIGVTAEESEAQRPEVGFQIPRDLFDNNLRGLIHELSAIRRIIRSISEATVGEVEEIEVGHISTSDPLFLFYQSVPVLLAISCAVKWALDRWKTVEEIRKLRAETERTRSFTEKEISDFFDKKIKDTIESSIQEKVQEYLRGSEADVPRKNELEKALTDALRSLMARIERGMTVEIRVPPVLTKKKEEENDEAAPELEQLIALKSDMRFPLPSRSPVLELPNAGKGDQS